MMGSAADVDDLVQDTLGRALERPPADLSQPLRSWLTRVAVNLSRDSLRRRRREGYLGPWLPTPIETSAEVSTSQPTSAARYGQLESASFAFLLALESLNPKQRAVVLLRDVFEYSTHETAEVIGASEPNVKQIHLRARRALGQYDAARVKPSIKENCGSETRLP
jgi:RNA polymerase sigma-70 factor (ECF subfamily)